MELTSVHKFALKTCAFSAFDNGHETAELYEEHRLQFFTGKERSTVEGNFFR